jgi:CubicO group peptidase (beta-lactamase class C family)
MVATITILLLAEARAQPTDTPPGFEQIESAFLAFMQANDLPGASLAIARNGRLVLARGYGVADVEQRQSMQPESLLRFGSIGKTITAIAIMKLCESRNIYNLRCVNASNDSSRSRNVLMVCARPG